MFLLEKVFAKFSKKRLSFTQLAVSSVIASFLGIMGAMIILPKQADTISVSITAILLADVFEKLLEANKDNIWKHGLSSFRANKLLTLQFLTVFVSIMITFYAFSAFISVEQIKEVFGAQANYLSFADLRSGFWESLKSNLWALLLSVMAAVLFMRRGASLVLTWFAAVWGVAGAILFHTDFSVFQDMSGPLHVTLGGFFIYLLLELTAYILIVMAGIFSVKAFQKYKIGSANFNQVIGAVSKIAAFSLLFVVVAAAIKANI